jgi:hypothetical protein
MFDVEELRRRVRAGGGTVTTYHIPQDRVGIPPFSIPLKSGRPTPTSGEMRLGISRVLELGRPAVAWCLWRASAYHAGPGRNWPTDIQDYAAAIDYLRWYHAQAQAQ